MKKPKISIIVPVYNVDRYLRKCLDSIKDQTFTDWECILVDDGSTDTSPAICEEYASRCSQFKTIHKHNGGLSSARNMGIRIAQGEFIGFIDSDDWIEPGMFQLLYDLIVQYDADVSQVGFIKEFIGRRSIKHLVSSVKVITGDQAMHETVLNRLPNYAWNKLHRRQIITCDFPEGRTFEDIYVYGQWLKNVRKMVIHPSPMYHYRMRKGSIIHSNVAKNRYDFFISSINRINMLDATEDKKACSKRNAYINKAAVSAAKIIARKEKNVSKRDEAINRISEEVKAYPLPSILHLGIKSWWRAKLLRSKPSFLVCLMKGVGALDLDRKDRERRYYD